MYDENGQVWGNIFVGKSEDGTYKVTSGAYGLSQMRATISQYPHDEVILLSDLGDYYYCLKNGSEEKIVPGTFTYGKKNFKTANPSWSISEFFSALDYRDTHDPYDPDLLGGRGTKPIYDYVGMYEKRTLTTIIVIASTILVVGAVVTITIIVMRKHKKRKQL